MKASGSIGMLCALALLASASTAQAQNTNSANSPASDPSITALSVMGVVTDLRTEPRLVIVTTTAGNQVTVTLSDTTEFMRIPPGEKTKDKFVKITPTDFRVGDSVFARGRMSEDRKSLPAREFYVMSKVDIAQQRAREHEQWRTRGIAGTISALNVEAKEISLDSRSSAGSKPVIIAANAETRFRRYAPDSVRFSDARTSSFAELKVGDQLRALGTKSADGGRFTPEEVVSGSFQTIGGPITEVDAAKQQIKINDLQSHQTVTIVVSKDSSMRRLTPEVLAVLSPPKAGTAGAAPAPAPQPNASATKGSGDLQEMFEQLPTLTLQELKPGESILVSSTKGAEVTRVTAIAVVSGVGPLLQNSQSGRPTGVSLGAMNLGGP